MNTTTQLSRRKGLQAVLASAIAMVCATAAAQTFPDKPLKIVVGAPAGGSADVIARSLGEGLSQLLGQPVVVDNKPGAAGLIGTQELLKAPRDGHTLMVAVNGLVSEIPHVMKLPFDPMKELKPVAELARTGLVFVAGPQVPASDVKGAVAHIKANPGKISYASYSTGSMSHTLGLEFNKLMGTDMVHVGYRGSPPALLDVMAGTTPFMFDGPATSIPLVKGGKVKALATTAPQRMGVLPDVPTFAELGYKDLTEVVWMGLWTTPDVPAANQAKVRDAVLKVLQTPKVREQFAGLGLEMGTAATPDDLSRSLKAASDKQAALLKAIGFKPE
ncbi:MAG: putative extra-cytoplasmic solute receptor [Pseudomonadota bacterium]